MTRVLLFVGLLGACARITAGHAPHLASAMRDLRRWQAEVARDSSGRVAAFRRVVLDAHREVYGPVLSVPNDERLARYLEWLSPRIAATHTIAEHATELLPATIQQVAAVFPPLAAAPVRAFIGPSLGSTNGTVRLVNGRPLLIVGADVQTILSDSASLVRALLAHELVHVAHAVANPAVYAQVDAGVRGVPTPLYLSLFSEGLAVWGSRRAAAEVTPAQALMSPTLADESRPRCGELSRRLASDLESTDPRRLAEWFFLSGTDTSIPRRFAYYAGERVVNRLSRRFAPAQLLLLTDRQILDEVRATLADDATCSR